MKLRDILTIVIPIIIFIAMQTLFYERRLTRVETKVDLILSFSTGGTLWTDKESLKSKKVLGRQN